MLRELADAVARLPKSTQQLIMSAIPQEPVLHLFQRGRSERILFVSLQETPCCPGGVVAKNIMSSARC